MQAHNELKTEQKTKYQMLMPSNVALGKLNAHFEFDASNKFQRTVDW